jgi:nitric oxide reductase activation protein
MPNTNNTEETKDQIKKTQDTPEKVEAAHKQAEKDIAQDADLSIQSPNDDLDEAETARLGDDKNDLGGRI